MDENRVVEEDESLDELLTEVGEGSRPSAGRAKQVALSLFSAAKKWYFMRELFQMLKLALPLVSLTLQPSTY